MRLQSVRPHRSAATAALCLALRASLAAVVPAERWNTVRADAGDEAAVRAALERLRRLSRAATVPSVAEATA